MSLESSAPSRRDVLKQGGKMSLAGYATCACAGGGACALAIPALNSLNGVNAQTESLSEEAILEIDLSEIQAGEHKIVRWRGLPVFIQHRTEKMLSALKNPELLSKLRDPQSKRKQQPPDAANWHRSVRPEYLVLISICTHLGCIAKYEVSQDSAFRCPCHGSWFDPAGRVFKNMPAGFNLPVPPVAFKKEEDRDILCLGESEKYPDFSLSEIEKI